MTVRIAAATGARRHELGQPHSRELGTPMRRPESRGCLATISWIPAPVTRSSIAGRPRYAGTRLVRLRTYVGRAGDTHEVIRATVPRFVAPKHRKGIDAGTFVLVDHASTSSTQRRGGAPRWRERGTQSIDAPARPRVERPRT